MHLIIDQKQKMNFEAAKNYFFKDRDWCSSICSFVTFLFLQATNHMHYQTYHENQTYTRILSSEIGYIFY